MRARSVQEAVASIHSLVLDGVFTRSMPTATPVFHALPAPTHAEVAEVLGKFHRRVQRLLRRRVVLPEEESSSADPVAEQMPLLAEHAEAVANIEAIVRVPGIDAVLLGPYDLSASLGKMGQIDDPGLVAAIRRVTDVCRAGLPLGYFGVTAAAVQPYVAQGYTLIVAGVDTLYLG